MSIQKSVRTPNGMAMVTKVVSAKLEGEKLALQVHMYPSAEQATDANLVWQEYPELPVSVLDVQDPMGSLERALIEQADGMFAGGVYLAEPLADDLETARARKWAQIKGLRDDLENGGFEVQGLGRFDSDSESRARIVGAAMAAKIAQDAEQSYAIRWTLADNTTVDLNAEDVIRVGFGLLAHTDGIHQRSRQIFALINAAETVEAVESIGWETSEQG